MKPRISMIALAVNNLDKAIKFYQEGLDLPKMKSPSNLAFFNLNGTWLALAERETLVEDAAIPLENSGFGGYNGVTLAHNVAAEHEVDQVIEEALAAGATIVKPPQKSSWGGYHSYFKDLDGYLWEVVYNPFTWFGPEDEDA